MKRLFDLVVGGIILLLSIPLMLFTSLLIFFCNGSPIFYVAKRAGKNNDNINMYKFRTMVKNADAVGPSVTYGEDARITRLGKFLRNTKIDELPQIINVIKGNMSIVGPRPESLDIVEQYSDEQKKVLTVKPGLTGLGALHYYTSQQDEKGTNSDSEDYYIQYQLPTKLKMDIDYLKRYKKYGVFEDIRIILLTIYTIFLISIKK